mgnify:FL=1
MINTSLEVIGYVRCDYKEKFGIPRQSGLTGCATAFIEMLPPYNQAEAFRGLDEFSHLWLLWDFSKAHKNGFTATVKPPKLGGNQRMGVFATRSPFRPNNIGLSSVRLLDIIYNEETGCVHGLVVSGADILDGTPVYDIKPYLPYTDSHPEATGGWTDSLDIPELSVCFSDDIAAKLETIFSSAQIEALKEILAQDPRPGYQDEPGRRYGMLYGGYDIRFNISGDTLTICEVAEPGSQ